MTQAICEEIALRHDYLTNKNIQTIYFGGGTPSILPTTGIDQIVQTIREYFTVAKDAEITLEANPDDLSIDKLVAFKDLGINRLSIGIQSFNEDALQFINRAHSRNEAMAAIEMAQSAGFNNISADLIYAIPPEDMTIWQQDIATLLSFKIPHVSIYGLTIEEKTVFGHLAKKGKFKEVGEQVASSQFELAISQLTAAGYEHYEVSNFALPGFHSRHNAAYWDDHAYLGLGPGAHSYDGNHRAYNVSNNTRYIQEIKARKTPLTIEILNETEKANEYIFTHLRRSQGIDLIEFETKLGKNLVTDYADLLDGLQQSGHLKYNNQTLQLTSSGFMIADEITWRLFYE